MAAKAPQVWRKNLKQYRGKGAATLAVLGATLALTGGCASSTRWAGVGFLMDVAELAPVPAGQAVGLINLTPVRREIDKRATQPE